MPRFRTGILLMLAALAAVGPARGAGPKVGLRLEQVRCREAAAALARAVGVVVEVRPWTRTDLSPPGDPRLADLDAPASFDWSDTTFAQALRQLCDWYSLRAMPSPGGGYRLQQEAVRQPVPAHGPAPQVEAGGMRVQVLWLSVTGDFSGRDRRLGAAAPSAGTLRVGLARRAAGGWGPLRWQEVDVIGGAARLEDLQPGIYRLVRTYEATEPSMQKPGRWLGTEVVITLESGKETVAPPLKRVSHR